MKTDIQIAQETVMQPINEVAANFGIDVENLEFYGKYKAKIEETLFKKVSNHPRGKLVLVTAINPTPSGEGKTTTTIGLAQALNKLGKKTFAALREPSLGPCMGMKGGAAGGGYSQVVPMEDINLHFTGDIHAITCAHNLLSSIIDNHIYQGNQLGIDPERVVWRRAVDLNDRTLRNVTVGVGGNTNGVTRQDGFMITVASELMAIVCLAEDLADAKRRIGGIIVGYTYYDEPVYVRDLKAAGAMTTLLKDALNPNLVQTLEHTPAFIHGGPFANIAHGCNSVRATKLALALSDITVTEAGFGADLGAQKFFDIKCRMSGLRPDAVVLVATVRALKYNGAVARENLALENLAALKTGFANLEKHIENLQKYSIPVVVTLNIFESDTKAEVDFVKETCENMGCHFARSEVYSKGGEGGIELAQALLDALEEPANFTFLYPDDMPIKEKISTIAREIYGARGVLYTARADKAIAQATGLGAGKFPVCIAKTQYSLSDDATKLGRPTDFEITIKDVCLMGGAGFVVALAGDILTMPGLPKNPAACEIDIDDEGRVSGLF